MLQRKKLIFASLALLPTLVLAHVERSARRHPTPKPEARELAWESA